MGTAQSIALIETIERHSAWAWPAPVIIALHGWEMRFAPNSSSRRVNSLNPVAPVAGQFRDVLRTYRDECWQRGCQAYARLLPLARDNETAVLSGLGIDPVGATSVEVRNIRSLKTPDSEVIITPYPTDAWLDTYIRAHGYGVQERAAVEAILATRSIAMGFALGFEDGEPVATGRTAIINGLAGFYHIATIPGARRRGHARRIMAALEDFATRNGAEKGYLQVEIRNTGARDLYASLGFESLYIYDYWPLPTSISI